ncbi:hypothetical protein V6000_001922 [Aspergillus fumigatus]
MPLRPPPPKEGLAVVEQDRSHRPPVTGCIAAGDESRQIIAVGTSVASKKTGHQRWRWARRSPV